MPIEAVERKVSAIHRQAVIYRMATPDHLCPYGLKSLDLLHRHGFEVEDHPLTTRQRTDEFMRRHGVETTPQTFIGSERVGGLEDLRRHFGIEVPDPDEPRYAPVLVVFTVAALAAVALAVPATVDGGAAATVGQVVQHFVALATLMLAMLKLRDLEAFTNRFLGYDLLAQRVVRYAYVYPFAEAFVALAMLAGWRHALPGAVAVVVGGIGAASVFKAVYVDRRELVCACVGGGSKVPLGAVSMTENLVMVAMGLWMIGGGLSA